MRNDCSAVIISFVVLATHDPPSRADEGCNFTTFDRVARSRTSDISVADSKRYVGDSFIQISDSEDNEMPKLMDGNARISSV